MTSELRYWHLQPVVADLYLFMVLILDIVFTGMNSRYCDYLGPIFEIFTLNKQIPGLIFAKYGKYRSKFMDFVSKIPQNWTNNINFSLG